MPTLKQKKAFKETLENGGVVSRAMLEAGYSEAMAKNPQKLTESDGWQELMDTYLPDSLLAKKHKELLNKRTLGSIDVQAVKSGLDMAYRLKGKYAEQKIDLTTKGKKLPGSINIIATNE